MKTLKIQSELEIGFDKASKMADGMAISLLGEDTSCLSWYDKLRDHECPAGVSECHDVCDIPGFIEYAETRGAQLKIDVNKGTFIFCYVTVNEFDAADHTTLSAERNASAYSDAVPR
jgi:hypothetical protein